MADGESNAASILAGLDRCTRDVLTAVAGANDACLFTQPGEGQWSVAEIVEHLILVDVGAVRTLRGTNQPTTRDSDMEVPYLDEAMADRTRPVNTPELVTPKGRYKARGELVEAFESMRGRLIETAHACDLALLYPDARLPYFGELTGYEWVRFITSHTDRHVAQMRQILAGPAEG